MYNQHELQSRITYLTFAAEDYGSAVDPEFDSVYDDLEREFAELGPQLSHNG